MARTSKNENRLDATTSHIREVRISDGYVYTDRDEAGNYNSYYERRVTQNTPGYRSVRRQKVDLPMNGFEYDNTVRSFPYGTARAYRPNGTGSDWSRVGSLTDVANFGSYELTNEVRSAIDDRALFGSLKDLKGMDVNLGNAFGERKRTADLILGAAKDLGAAIGNVKRGNIRGAIDSLARGDGTLADRLWKDPRRRRISDDLKKGKASSLADRWLQLQYGAIPLLSDVHGAAEQLARMADKPWPLRVTTSRSFKYNGTNTAPGEQWNTCPVRRRENTVYTRKYVYVFTQNYEHLSSLAAWGITNPLAVAYELQPWSFVYDWFLRIGEWIDTFDATAFLQFDKGCTTSFEKVEVRYKASATRSLDDGDFWECFGRAYGLDVKVRRVALSGFVHPAMPRLGTFLTPTRTANAVALTLQQYFGGWKYNRRT